MRFQVRIDGSQNTTALSRSARYREAGKGRRFIRRSYSSAEMNVPVHSPAIRSSASSWSRR